MSNLAHLFVLILQLQEVWMSQAEALNLRKLNDPTSMCYCIGKIVLAKITQNPMRENAAPFSIDMCTQKSKTSRPSWEPTVALKTDFHYNPQTWSSKNFLCLFVCLFLTFFLSFFLSFFRLDGALFAAWVLLQVFVVLIGPENAGNVVPSYQRRRSRSRSATNPGFASGLFLMCVRALFLSCRALLHLTSRFKMTVFERACGPGWARSREKKRKKARAREWERECACTRDRWKEK